LFKVDLYSKPGRNGWLSATSVDHSIKWIEWCKRLYHNLLSHLEEWITWEYQISGLKDWAGAGDQLQWYEGKWTNWAASLLTVAWKKLICLQWRHSIIRRTRWIPNA
jgi:hypothetical protein